MTEGIHGDRPVSYQIDRAVAVAEERGQSITRIVAAKPFAEALAAELSETLSFASTMWSGMVYRGISIETDHSASTGWVAYDLNGQPIDTD